MGAVNVVMIPFSTWATIFSLLFLLVCICYRRNRMITSIVMCIIVGLAFLPQLLTTTLTMQVQDYERVEQDITEAKILKDAGLISFKDKNYYIMTEFSDELETGFYAEIKVREDKKLFTLKTDTGTKHYVIQMDRLYKDVYVTGVEDREELMGNAEEEEK